jgi:hypothetical protein
MVHRLGWGAMLEAVESKEDAALEQLPVLGGFAVVNNARERTASVEGFLIRTTVKSLTKEPAMNAALLPRPHLSCKTRGIWRARQDSNLRPSDS